MKHCITYICQYILIFSVALLMAPAKSVHTYQKMNEMKIEKTKQQTQPEAATSEVVHGEMLFRY